MNSAFPRISQPVSSDTRRSRINGVFPTYPSMPECVALMRFSIPSRNSHASSQFSITSFFGTLASTNYCTSRAEHDLQIAGFCDALFLCGRLNEICRDLHRPLRNSLVFLLSTSDIQASPARHTRRVDFARGLAHRVTPTGAVHRRQDPFQFDCCLVPIGASDHFMEGGVVLK